jgi:hypothetical protein
MSLCQRPITIKPYPSFQRIIGFGNPVKRRGDKRNRSCLAIADHLYHLQS